MNVLIILFIIVLLPLIALFMRSSMDYIPADAEFEEIEEEETYEEVEQKFFDASIRRFLEKKYPTLVSYNISCGHLNHISRSTKLGFKIFTEDSAEPKYELVYVSQIFTDISNESIERQIEIVNEVELERILTNVLLKVDEEQEKGTHSFEMELKLNNEKIESLREILLGEGLKTKLKDNMLTIIIP